LFLFRSFLPQMVPCRIKLVLGAIAVLVVTAYHVLSPVVQLQREVAALPRQWPVLAASSFISPRRDKFDLAFDRYPVRPDKPAARKTLRVPPILHSIALDGALPRRPDANASIQTCVDLHPGWDVQRWHDDNARDFVGRYFPDLLDVWSAYPYPEQRADALRYMLLEKMGGESTPLVLGLSSRDHFLVNP
jgi:hypothetical protein